MKASHPCSSTTSCQDNAPQNGSRLASGAKQLLLRLLCGPGLVKLSAPLLGLQAAIANMASHCRSVYILGLCILWCDSLQVSRGLTLILDRKLCIEGLLPIQRALWQPLTIAWGSGPRQLTTVMHGAHHCILQQRRPLKWEASLVLLSMAQWACYSLTSFRHENSKAVELLLRAVLQQVAASLLLRWPTTPAVGQAVLGRLQRPGCGHLHPSSHHHPF